MHSAIAKKDDQKKQKTKETCFRETTKEKIYQTTEINRDRYLKLFSFYNSFTKKTYFFQFNLS